MRYNGRRRLNMLVKIETYFDGEFWCARGIGEDIFTQGKSLDELHENIKEAVAIHYGDIDEPITILTLSEVKLTDAKATAG
jgi:predicted RNase H-like HicB family nuclease